MTMSAVAISYNVKGDSASGLPPRCQSNDENGLGRLRGVVDQRDAKPGQVFQPVRVAIAGQTVSPGIFETVAVLGRAETLARIDAALARAAT